jgi:hypothetical protein
VCVFGCVSYLVCRPYHHMSCRTTRKCKETLLQVRERLTREQANRTKKRVRELLDLSEDGSDSDSEGSQEDSIDEDIESLSLIRRDLYLGLLCLLLLFMLLAYWVSITFLRREALYVRYRKPPDHVVTLSFIMSTSHDCSHKCIISFVCT